MQMMTETPQPIVVFDMSKNEKLDDLYRYAIYYEKASIQENVLFIYYDKKRASSEGRTLILTVNGHLIRTKSTPLSMMDAYKRRQENRYPTLALLNIDIPTKGRPFVFGDQAYIPITKSATAWIAIHHVKHFVDVENQRTLIQVEFLSSISLRLNYRYEKIYTNLNVGFIMWKLQYKMFKSLYHLQGHNSHFIIGPHHFYRQLLNDNVVGIGINQREIKYLFEKVNQLFQQGRPGKDLNEII